MGRAHPEHFAPAILRPENLGILRVDSNYQLLFIQHQQQQMGVEYHPFDALEGAIVPEGLILAGGHELIVGIFMFDPEVDFFKASHWFNIWGAGQEGIGRTIQKGFYFLLLGYHQGHIF